MGVTDRERFLYDLQGFLVVPGVLSADEVARCNEAIDANLHFVVDHHKGTRSPALEGSAPRRLMTKLLEWEKPFCDPFRELLVKKSIVPYLNAFLGVGWRLDQLPFGFLADKGAEGLHFHGAGRFHPGDGFFYDYTAGRILSGMVVVEYALTDQGPGDGGFGCIPGTHKSNFLPPQDILDWETDKELVHQPVLRAGDVLIFNEATIHGTFPWTADHQRRLVLYRYSPKYVTVGGGLAEYRLPAWTDELTPLQRAIFAAPGITAAPHIDDDSNLIEHVTSEYAN